MKTVARYRVKKRDGREEWLRTSKLARSIGRALASARSGVGGVAGDEWRAVDLALAVLTGLRGEFVGEPVTTKRLAEAVQQVLVATACPGAAAVYVRSADARRRRRSVVRAAARDAVLPVASAEHGPGGSACPRDCGHQPTDGGPPDAGRL